MQTTKSQQAGERTQKQFIVTVRFQYPHYTERDGISSEPVNASCKSEAIKRVRRDFSNRGIAGPGCQRGRQIFGAKEFTE